MNAYEVISWKIITYAIIYTLSKLAFSIISIIQIKIYTKKYSHIATEDDLRRHAEQNKHSPPLITIINPAYNEELTVIDSAKSFLNQTHPRTEVIIVNDGSSDQTLEKLIQEFDLYEAEDNIEVSKKIVYERVRSYYKSHKNDNLMVIDKENGGKADALNAGIAIASGEVIATIDADSVLESNALLHITDIFEQDPKIVAIGTPIRILNDSNVGPDGVEDASFPKNFLAKNQVMEYLRNFLLGRMAIQKFRGLVLISGAFGVYQKWIIEAVEGFSKGSMAEDVDIVCKIWKFLDHNKLKFTIKYVPEVFCWTQVPETLRDLKSQRDRWARGLTTTLWKNKNLVFNPRYKMLGLFSYPYYVFFEWWTPFIELGSLILFFPAVIMGKMNFTFLSHVFLIYYGVACLINFMTIGVEAFTGGHYKSRSSLRKLLLIAFIEPIFYHWLNSFLYVMGNLKLIFVKNRGWCSLKRKKFNLRDEEERSELLQEQVSVVLTAKVGRVYY